MVRPLVPETPRERLLQERIARESHIPLESLKNPTVNHFVNVAAAVNRINTSFETASPESTQRPRSDGIHQPMVVGQELSMAGWAARFSAWQATIAEDQWLRGGLPGQTEASTYGSLQAWGFLLPSAHFAGLALEPVEPTAKYSTPEPGLWRDPASSEHMSLAGETHPNGAAIENQLDDVDRQRAWEVIDREARRSGEIEFRSWDDPDRAASLLVLARSRALMEATAPEVLDNLPPAPGLTPTAQERLAVTHQVNRVVVAALEHMIHGKKPPTEALAPGLADALRPLGATVIVDPEHE